MQPIFIQRRELVQRMYVFPFLIPQAILLLFIIRRHRLVALVLDAHPPALFTSEHRTFIPYTMEQAQLLAFLQCCITFLKMLSVITRKLVQLLHRLFCSKVADEEMGMVIVVLLKPPSPSNPLFHVAPAPSYSTHCLFMFIRVYSCQCPFKFMRPVDTATLIARSQTSHAQKSPSPSIPQKPQLLPISFPLASRHTVIYASKKLLYILLIYFYTVQRLKYQTYVRHHGIKPSTFSGGIQEDLV